MKNAHPVALWVVSTSRQPYEKPDPTDALHFVLHPIRQLLQTGKHDILLLLRQLSILATRFKHDFLQAVQVHWNRPLSNDYFLLEDICFSDLGALAVSMTFAMHDYHNRLFNENSLELDDRLLQDLGKRWERFRDDVEACYIADASLDQKFLKLAEVGYHLI